MRKTLFSFGALALFMSFVRVSAAETYKVGPSRTDKDLQAVQGRLKAGDIVEVDGDATYPGGVFFRAAQSGEANNKVTIRGMKVNGKRPVISGGGTGNLDGIGMVLNANHYVLESLEVTGSAGFCIVHKGDDITIKDFVVHDCPKQGLLGNDYEAGSLTLQHSEFYKNGGGQLDHQVYMATAEDMYPNAVFRMEHCYVHDGNGGNNVKSRAGRNEIYYNWIESSFYHGLELIGPDQSPATPRREDSDVVGNVIIGNGSQKWHLVRAGGDKAEADTSGRYRFVNNTFVLGPTGNGSVFRLMLRVDAVEMHNNAFVRSGAGGGPLFKTDEVTWVNGESIIGSNNWVQEGITGAPAGWTGTLTGADPGMTNLAAFDVRPKEGSPLLDKGTSTPAPAAGRDFPNPLVVPAFVPPSRLTTAAPEARPAGGALDIGAYELGTGVAPPPPGTGNNPPGSSSGNPNPPNPNDAGGGAAAGGDGGGCSVGPGGVGAGGGGGGNGDGISGGVPGVNPPNVGPANNAAAASDDSGCHAAKSRTGASAIMLAMVAAAAVLRSRKRR